MQLVYTPWVRVYEGVVLPWSQFAFPNGFFYTLLGYINDIDNIIYIPYFPDLCGIIVPHMIAGIGFLIKHIIET